MRIQLTKENDMKKLALIISLSCLTAACQTMEGIGEDISNIDMPSAPKLTAETAPVENPNAGEKQGAYKEPQEAAVVEQEIDIKRDFPAYHTSPRFDNEPEPASGK
jgi:predicted small secreted protein